MNQVTMNNKLFFCLNHVPSAKLRVFLFPYAGGSMHSYSSWAQDFNDEIELVFVQSPGRGARLCEKPFDNMTDLVNEIMLSSAFLCEKPSIFFGHSLGSRVAYETCVQLQSRGLRLPKHLIASGSKAAHIESDKHKNMHDLPEKEFIDTLRDLNGTPQEILENDELIELLSPLLRADFKVAECYLAEGKKLPIPITALGGEQDIDVNHESLMAWKELTYNDFHCVKMPGDHFFINTHRQRVTHVVNKVILNLLEPSAPFVNSI
ncbi:MAG: thioesterase domain-containing protein [Pseudomonadota bacterium]